MEMTCMSIDLVATGKRITEIRKAKGFKVSDISDYMGFENPQAVYKWQRGDSLPDLENMVRLMNLFEIHDFREVLVMTGSDEQSLPFPFFIVILNWNTLDLELQ